MATVYECDRCHKQQKEPLVTIGDFGEREDDRLLLIPSCYRPFRQELCIDCQRALGQWQRAGGVAKV